MRSIAIRGSFVVSFLLLTACHHGPDGPLNMAPRYTPTSKIGLGVIQNSSTQLTLQVVDQRNRGDLLGRNSEESPPVEVHASPADVTKFVTEGLTREITGSGYSIVPQAPLGFTITILEVWGEEVGTYKGSVRLKVDVTKNGAVVDSFTVTGNSSRWGASLSEENYDEVLSDSLVNAIKNLITSPNFQKALAPEAVAAP